MPEPIALRIATVIQRQAAHRVVMRSIAIRAGGLVLAAAAGAGFAMLAGIAA
jgi:hypothetical protein